MVPDSDLQLQVVIKALREAVGPAIRADEKVAQEQLQLSLATLGVLRSQLPMTRRFIRALSHDALDLAGKLGALASSQTLSAPREALEAALADPARENHEIEAARGALMDSTCALIETLGPDLADQARRVVIDASALPIERQRAWFIGSAFEPAPDKVRPIETLLEA